MFNKLADENYYRGFADRRDTYRIPNLEQINLEGMRLYSTPSGTRYPSMSSLTKLLSEDSIKNWRNRVGPSEASKISSRASKRGTAVHKLAEHYILGQRKEFESAYGKSMPDTQLNWSGVKEELDSNFTEVFASECQLYSNSLRLAGTTDCIGIYKGKLCVIDFKTSMKWKKKEWIEGYFIQCDGYGEMWRELTGETPENIVVIIATDVRREPQIFIEPFGMYLAKLKKLRLEFYKRHKI